MGFTEPMRGLIPPRYPQVVEPAGLIQADGSAPMGQVPVAFGTAALDTQADATREAPPDSIALRTMVKARQAFFATLGWLDPLPLLPPRYPGGSGEPVWPALRQSWSVIRRPTSTLVFSHGLSDPFDPLTPADAHRLHGGVAPVPGLGLEVFAEARGIFSDVRQSWLFDLVHQVSQIAATHGHLLYLLRRHGVISLQMRVAGLPEGWVSAQGRATVLLGVPAASVPGLFQTPHGQVQTVALTLISVAQRHALEQHVGEFSDQVWHLGERLGRLPEGHINTLESCNEKTHE